MTPKKPFRYHQYQVIRVTKSCRDPGYACQSDITHQIFYRDEFALWGMMQTGRTVLFKEEIPQDVLIDLGCFGATEWRSSCPRDIHEKCDRRHVEAL